MSFSFFARRLLDREPMVVIATGIGVLGIATAAFVPRIRHSLGYNVDQYYGWEDPDTGLMRAPRTRGKLTWEKPEIGAKPELVIRDE